MTSFQNGDKWRWITSWWPIIVTALAITVTAAQANQRLDSVGARVDIIEQHGTIPSNERLARLETRSEQLQLTLNRVEQKLDNELEISPESRKRLKRL